MWLFISKNIFKLVIVKKEIFILTEYEKEEI
jgi:hypothetical protein